MKRLCVFAHWDRDNIIDDYCLYYLKALREIADYVIFVSDSDIEKSGCSKEVQPEIKKLDGLADYVITGRHGEYDFGSYKRGFLLAEEKGLEFDELIWANDSCYGPFYPLEPIFRKMEKKKYDFWGMTKNPCGICVKKGADKVCFYPHLQSCFLVFKPCVFNSSVFRNFVNGIKKEKRKNDVVIKYEMGLYKSLKKAGFKSGVFINAYSHTENSLLTRWDKLVQKYGFPFLKTAIAKNGSYWTGEVKDWDKIFTSGTGYPAELIRKHSQRVLNLYENKYEKMNLYRKVRFRILFHSPLEIRFCVIYLEKHLFKVLNTLCFNKLKKF